MQAEVSPDAPLFEDFIVAGLARDAPDKPIVPKVLYNFKKDTGIKDDIGVKDVIEFCFPDLEDVNGPSDSFTFTLTKVEGTRIFGYCRHLIQKGQMPICLCVVSRRPWFTLFQEMLSIVQSNYDLARFVPAFVPSAHAATAKAGSGSRDLYIEPLLNGQPFYGRFKLKPPADSRPTGVKFEALLSCLGPGTLMRVLGALMTEQKVVFSGSRWGHVSACAHAATCLVYPLEWQHIYIPVLPTSKISYASAPMPYIVGVLDRHLPTLEAEPLDGVLFVDVDKGILAATDEQTLEMSQLPTPFREHLGARLQALQKAAKDEKRIVCDDDVAKAVLGTIVRLLGAYKQFVKRGLGNKEGVHTDFDEDGFIKFAPEPAQKFLRAMRGSQLFEVWVCQHVDMSEEQRALSSFERLVAKCPAHELGGAALMETIPPPEKGGFHLGESAAALKKMVNKDQLQGAARVSAKALGAATIAGFKMGKLAAAAVKEKAGEIKVADLKDKFSKMPGMAQSPGINPCAPSTRSVASSFTTMPDDPFARELSGLDGSLSGGGGGGGACGGGGGDHSRQGGRAAQMLREAYEQRAIEAEEGATSAAAGAASPGRQMVLETAPLGGRAAQMLRATFEAKAQPEANLIGDPLSHRGPPPVWTDPFGDVSATLGGVWTPSPSKSSPSVSKRATAASTATDLADVFGSTLGVNHPQQIGVNHPQQIHPTAPAAPTPMPAPGPPSTTYDFEPGARIGLSLADHSSGAIAVMEVVDGTLAQQKGVMVGMTLLAVNGEKVAGLSKDAAMEIVKRYANTTRHLTFSNEQLAARAPAPAPPPPAHDIMQLMLAASSTDKMYGSFSCG